VAAGTGPTRTAAAVGVASVSQQAAVEAAFAPSPRPGHYLLDLYALARIRLRAAGVDAIYGGGFCTLSDPRKFYSYRRDGVTGRMASVIQLK
jgi:polyphenol oxidase